MNVKRGATSDFTRWSKSSSTLSSSPSNLTFFFGQTPDTHRVLNTVPGKMGDSGIRHRGSPQCGARGK